MDILTHTLSGIAVATCAATFVPATFRAKLKVLCVGAIGGALPDIDAISLWSRFNGTIGKLFGLADKGTVIYGSKFWYSHHGFFHSLLASVLLGIILIGFLYLFSKNKTSFSLYCKTKHIYFITFVLAYWAHLAGDLPTPSSVWGGIALFWPSLDYVGGSGEIWWWNNYDIFLLVVLSIFVNFVVLIFSKRLKEKARLMTLSVLLFFVGVIVYQINTRQYDYQYEGNSTKYSEMEKNSKKEQERILGKRLYEYMEAFDRKMIFLF